MLYERLIGLQTPPDRKEKRKNFVAKHLCRDLFLVQYMGCPWNLHSYSSAKCIPSPLISLNVDHWKNQVKSCSVGLLIVF